MDVNREEINIVKIHDIIGSGTIKRKVPGSSEHNSWENRGIVLLLLAKGAIPGTLIEFAKEFPALLDSSQDTQVTWVTHSSMASSDSLNFSLWSTTNTTKGLWKPLAESFTKLYSHLQCTQLQQTVWWREEPAHQNSQAENSNETPSSLIIAHTGKHSSHSSLPLE